MLTAMSPGVLDIPAGTQPGAVLSVANWGVPRLGQGQGRGTMHFTVETQLPALAAMTPQQEGILKELRVLSKGAGGVRGTGEATGAGTGTAGAVWS